MNAPSPPTDKRANSDNREQLDADTLALLTQAQGSSDFASDAQARVRHQLMTRIAQDNTAGHHTVAAGSGKWHGFAPGIERKVLHERADLMSYLLRLQPGAVLPAHHHPIDEECVVLQGSLRIGSELVLSAGDFHLAHEGLPHDNISTDDGALIFLRGASPLAEHLL